MKQAWYPNSASDASGGQRVRRKDLGIGKLVVRVKHLDHEEREERERSSHFHPKVAAGERGTALPALPAKPQVSDDGKVVEPADRLEAREAARAGPDNALLEWQPRHEYVQKRPDHQAEDDDEDAPEDGGAFEPEFHAERIASATASGDIASVAIAKSAHSAYSGSRAAITVRTSSRPPCAVRLGLREAVVGSA